MITRTTNKSFRFRASGPLRSKSTGVRKVGSGTRNFNRMTPVTHIHLEHYSHTKVNAVKAGGVAVGVGAAGYGTYRGVKAWKQHHQAFQTAKTYSGAGHH